MDFEASLSQSTVPEFLAVVLAGFGHELAPLSSDLGGEPCPKALIPIANQPMLDYPLAWVEQSGIKDVLLICPVSHRPAISHYIHSGSSTSFSSLRIDLQTFDETQDLSIGTCAVLRHFSHLIQQDFVILPCDFVPPPSLPLTKLLNKFRTEAVADGCIATACWFEANHSEKGSSPDEWGEHNLATPVVYDESSAALLYVDTPDDVDRNGDELELRMSLLTRYPRSKLSSNLQDSHVYVCKQSILQAMDRKSRLDSIREEFMPWLCKVQYQRTKRERYGAVLAPVTNALSQATALQHSTSRAVNDVISVKHGLLSSNDKDLPPSPTEHEDQRSVRASFRVGLVLHRADAGLAARANTLHSLLYLNRQFLSGTTYTLPSDAKDRSLIDPKAQISSDSIIGESTRLEERASIKRSVIGKHCIIGKMAKIVGCVLLDHCVIGDSAKLDGCVLGKNTKVGSKAELTRCITQGGYEIEADGSYKNEKLDVSDWTAAAPSTEDEETSADEQSDDVESGSD